MSGESGTRPPPAAPSTHGVQEAQSGDDARDADPLLLSLVEMVRAVLPGADHVRICVTSPDGRVRSRASTDPVASTLDVLQHRVGQGPWLDVVGADEVTDLATALATRKTIGQAQGILMATYGIGDDAAFAYLSRLAATTETKVRDVAAVLVAEANGHDGTGLT